MGEPNNRDRDSVDQTIFLMKGNRNRNPIDLLQRFFPDRPKNVEVSGNSQELDLSLKLTLGGLYSDCWEDKCLSLTRSSSIGEELMTRESVVEDDDSKGDFPFLSLERSSSLPVEAEAGLIRLKDVQRMRRMKARRKSLLDKRGRVSGNSLPHEGLDGLAEAECKSSSPKQDTDSETVPMETANGKTQVSEPNHENPSKKCKAPVQCVLKDDGMRILRQMPSVSTTGDVPNGKRIEGFLYRYMKGQVRIVCVCHGRFLSPSEFVKHAGGKDVANPMKHINVCLTSLSF